MQCFILNFIVDLANIYTHSHSHSLPISLYKRRATGKANKAHLVLVAHFTIK